MMSKARILPFTLLLALSLAAQASAQSQSPDLTVTAPTDGAMIQGASVAINFQVSGIKLVKTNVPLSEAGKHPGANHPGEGHLHITVDLQPLVVWEKSDPYTVNNLAPGDHQVMVEIAQNDHSSLSPPVMREIHFKTELPLPATGSGAGSSLSPGFLLLALPLLLLLGGLALRRRASVSGADHP